MSSTDGNQRTIQGGFKEGKKPVLYPKRKKPEERWQGEGWNRDRKIWLTVTPKGIVALY